MDTAPRTAPHDGNSPDRLQLEAAEARAALIATAREWKERTVAAVDPTPWAKKSPWMAVGAAAVAGLAAGLVVPAVALSASRAHRVSAIHRRAAQLHSGVQSTGGWASLASTGFWEKAFSTIMEVARLVTTGYLAQTAHATAETAADAATENNEAQTAATASQPEFAERASRPATGSFHDQAQYTHLKPAEPLEPRID